MSIIKEYRLKRGITQKQLAEHLDVSMMTIQRWESKKTVPTITDAKAICNKLKLPFKKLYLDY